MPSFQDITGKRYGRLTVVKKMHCKNKRWYWLCRCDCGNDIIVARNHLGNGHTMSCGCIHKEQLSKRNTTHGLKQTRLYGVWQSMKSRCYTPSNELEKSKYKDRGIKVCDEWLHNFQAFYDWAIANGYKEEKTKGGVNKLTIDRIDNNGNYEPSNCRWVDMKIQRSNQRPYRKDVNSKELKKQKIHYKGGQYATSKILSCNSH